MARRLLTVGQPLVLWNRSAAKMAQLAASGATLAGSSASLFETCDVVLMMTDATGTQIVLSQTSRLDNRLIVVMGTQSPADTVALDETVRRAGGRLLEVPVLGTVVPAAEGCLVALVGGDSADLDHVRPVLEVLARRIVPTGPVGTAACMKLAHNLLLSSYWTILGETLALASASGIDSALALDVLAGSAAANGLLDLKVPFLRGEAGAVAFDVAGMTKELAVSCAMGTSFGLALPVAGWTAELAQRAVDNGCGANDVATLALQAQVAASARVTTPNI